MQKNLYEIFDEVSNAPNTMDKIEVLRKNESSTLISFLRGVYDPNIVFDVSDVPPYKPSEDIKGMGWSNMTVELKRAYLFQVGHPKRPRELTPQRQKQVLIQILEALEPREAKLFENMLMKKLDVPGMSKLLVDTAFPNHTI
jgi:hypothetical protein